MTKHLKMNSQQLCRSHKQYVTVERGMAGYNFLFRFQRSGEKNQTREKKQTSLLF